MSRRSLGAALALACGLALSGCGTVSLTSPNTGPISSGTGIAAKVVQVTQATCQFIPTASTIASILSSAVPGLSTANAVARAICEAVAPLASGPGMEGVRQGYVGNVKVHGHFAE